MIISPGGEQVLHVDGKTPNTESAGDSLKQKAQEREKKQTEGCFTVCTFNNLQRLSPVLSRGSDTERSAATIQLPVCNAKLFKLFKGTPGH